ncbi:MAG TPA: hypothetical protein VK527_02735 [Candidatus Limnocylindrales bacterium]|nr:hypothetical protein [Candidatus Limnocylindrales bacterium]
MPADAENADWVNADPGPDAGGDCGAGSGPGWAAADAAACGAMAGAMGCASTGEALLNAGANRSTSIAATLPGGGAEGAAPSGVGGIKGSSEGIGA